MGKTRSRLRPSLRLSLSLTRSLTLPRRTAAAAAVAAIVILSSSPRQSQQRELPPLSSRLLLMQVRDCLRLPASAKVRAAGKELSAPLSPFAPFNVETTATLTHSLTPSDDSISSQTMT